MICIMRQRPRSDPKFHQTDRFLGEGRSIKEPLIILNRGCVFRKGPVIVFFIYNDFLFSFCNNVYWGDFGFL